MKFVIGKKTWRITIVSGISNSVVFFCLSEPAIRKSAAYQLLLSGGPLLIRPAISFCYQVELCLSALLSGEFESRFESVMFSTQGEQGSHLFISRFGLVCLSEFAIRWTVCLSEKHAFCYQVDFCCYQLIRPAIRHFTTLLEIPPCMRLHSLNSRLTSRLM